MENYFADLLEIMNKEIDIYDELKLVEQKKKQIIIDNDVKALEAITAREQGFVKAIVHLESLRAQVVDGFCRSKNIDEISTIDEIIELSSPPEKKEIIKSRDRLKNTINELMEITDLNSKLLEQSIEYVNYTLDLARSLGETELTYGKDAVDRKVKVDKNLFDAKI